MVEASSGGRVGAIRHCGKSLLVILGPPASRNCLQSRASLPIVRTASLAASSLYLARPCSSAEQRSVSCIKPPDCLSCVGNQLWGTSFLCLSALRPALVQHITYPIALFTRPWPSRRRIIIINTIINHSTND